MSFPIIFSQFLDLSYSLSNDYISLYFRLVFFHESTGEFWYDLRLHADPPPQTTLTHMECDLGRYVVRGHLSTLTLMENDLGEY